MKNSCPFKPHATANTSILRYCLQEKVRYRFSFNGKEKDDETYGDGNEFDFGARIYDSRLGRWLSMDPMQHKYPDASPYNFSLNSPISLNDPNGKWVERRVKRYDENEKLIPVYKFWVKAKTIEISLTIHNAKLYNGSSVNVSPDVMQKVADNIQRDVIENLSTTVVNDDGQVIRTIVKFNEPIQIIKNTEKSSMKGVGPRADNLYYLADQDAITKAFPKEEDLRVGATPLGSGLSVISIDRVGLNGGAMPRTAGHETGHQLGMDDNMNDPDSYMYQVAQPGQTVKAEDAIQTKTQPLNQDYQPLFRKIEKAEKQIKENK